MSKSSASVFNLSSKRCKPCEGGVPALSAPQVRKMLAKLPGWEGERVRADAATAHVPVVVVTSHPVSADERQRLSAVKSILSKSTLTRDALKAAIAGAVAGPHAVEKA